MRVGQRRWWILGGVCLLIVVGFILAAYRFGWSATGFLNKTVWDWLQLLIVPLVLAVVALLFQLANTRTERQIAKERYEQDQQISLDKQHEDLLQAYLDRMSELLLEKNLRTSTTDEVRNVARVRTTTVLSQLDGRRVGYVFSFLYEAGLMSVQANEGIIGLRNAHLSKVNWSNANLGRANLSGAILGSANLSEVILMAANLSEANLIQANLSGAILIDTDLRGADLRGADLRGAYLNKADLRGADLRGADLRGAEIFGADLFGANLSEAILDKNALSEQQLAQIKPRAKA